MKYIFLTCLVFLTTSAFAGTPAVVITTAKEIKSLKHTIPVARIVQLIDIVDKKTLRVAVAVEDLGFSTELAPNKHAYFTLYTKGDDFYVGASFYLGSVYSVESAKRISGGIYEIKLTTTTDNIILPEKKTLRINAIKAINDMKSVFCVDGFDCDAARDFQSKITTEWGAN